MSIISADDIHLNSRTFVLPGEVEKVLDLSAARLAVVRDNLEMALREKRVEFEKYIKEEKKGFDAFRLREVRDILTLDDLKEKVDTVNAIYETLEKCSKEAKAINIDEQLLQIDISNFQTLAVIIEKMDPVEKLWKTAYEFEKNHEIWMLVHLWT
uniref:Dynein heavy chain linker domain-containing protein n=1 Tax=Megaselia scalaris TaxID=36166 RepID=T1GTY0_MEGSC